MATGLLTGYRVLDLANELGVYGTKVLADLGAEVIKVEPPGGDPTRRFPPFYRGQLGSEYSLYFAYMNTNKRSVTLNLESDEGKRLFKELAKQADVVFETFPAGYLSKNGIGYPQLSELNPGLVWVAVTPFGQTGPRRDWKSSDLIGWAVSGLLYTTGDRERPPVNPGGPASLAYACAALNGAAGAALALRCRRRLGRGQMVDISLQEASIAAEIGMAAFLDDLLPRVRTGMNRPASAPNGLYACKDGYAALTVTLPQHWDTFAAWITEVTGIEGATDPIFRDRRYRLQAREVVDKWTEAVTRQYPKQELFEEGQRRGIPITPVNTMADLSHDPHLEARDYWAEMSHPLLGRLRMPGAPYRLDVTPWQAGRAPLLGEDDEAIYCGELGLSAADLAILRADGVI